MKTTTFPVTMLLALLVLVLCSPAHGHKIRTFAYENDGKIITETVFSGGRPAINATIKVLTAAGEPVLSGQTDNNGIFTFAIPQTVREQQPDLNIIAEVGEGHRGNWFLAATDYLPEVAAQQAPIVNTPASPVPTKDDLHNEEAQSEESCLKLEQRLETMIAKELAPIKRQLAEQQTEKPDLGDILSGLGYIFGLAGIVLYIQSRKTRSQQ